MAQNDGFTYENGVLINHKNIQNPSLLARIENDIAGVNAAILKQEGGIPGNFDQKHFQKVHKKLFQSVYPWAGETRADRGGFQGVKHTQVNLVPQEMNYAPFKEISIRLDAISKQLGKENNLKGLDPEKFTERAAYYLDQYNHVHPFREGNGRTLQAVLTQLGKEAGYSIDFSQADPAQYNEARNYAIVKPHSSQEADKNLAPLKNFLKQITTPLPGIEAGKIQSADTIKTPAPSPALRRIDALRELEATGTRIAERWDYLVKQQVKEIVEEPKALRKHEKDLRTISRSILEGGAKPDNYVYQDAERLAKALDQVKYIAAGKEIPVQTAPLAAHPTLDGQPKSHTEAKEIFIKASAIISRELADNGKPGEAEKLQGVSKFVSRVSFVGGINKEHVKNALDAANSINSLKESGHLSDIKNAVSILEKPEWGQGYTSKGVALSREEMER